METYNRGSTIYNAIMSVEHQTFRDFEVIIVDNVSTDNTVSEIERALKKCSFKYQFIQNSTRLPGEKNWNEPLKYAQGTYIAVLEGDDEFKPEHLVCAYSKLNGISIGIYATGNQIRKKEIPGIFNSDSIFKLLYSIHNLSPPSETIFISKHGDKKYFYDVDNYIYYPEADLLLRIAADGFSAVYDDNQNVIRGISTSKRKKYRWVYYTDAYTILEKYRERVGGKLYRKTLMKIIWLDVKLKARELLRELIRGSL
jgi:glycosyltransferase involved in cell wall biosynthesis